MIATPQIDYRNHREHSIYGMTRPRPDVQMTKDFTGLMIAETRSLTTSYESALKVREGRDAARNNPAKLNESRIAETFNNRIGDSSEFDPLRWDPQTALHLHMKSDRGLRDAISYFQGDNKAGISENQAMMGYSESKFHHELMRNIELGAQRTCELAAFGLIGCVNTINVGCMNNIMTTRPNYRDWLRTAKKLESTKFLKFDDVNCVQLLKPNKYKIAVAFCREDLCNPMHDQYLDMIQNLAVMDDIRKERALADLFFNLGAINADGNVMSRYPFIFNGNLMNTYIPVGAEGYPWQNHIVGDPFNPAEGSIPFPCPTRCEIDLLSIIEKLDEDRQDLSGSCLPVDCEGTDSQIIVASQCADRRIEGVLGAKTVEYCMKREDGCSGKFSQQEAGRSIGRKYSKWARQRIISMLMANCKSSTRTNDDGSPADLALSEAKQYVDCTWWIGQPDQFAAWAQEWEFQTFDRGSTNSFDTVNVTSESFDKEIMFMRKWLGKSSGVVTDPTRGTLMQALPQKAAA